VGGGCRGPPPPPTTCHNALEVSTPHRPDSPNGPRGTEVLTRLAAVRDVDGASYLETFVVSAVASILLIRLYLELMDYPRIGSGGLHIAHVLWGGFLMLLALVLLLGFLGKHVKRAAAVVGGVGFGAFIDELGKFITSDNNYFYRPTAALIYVIFIGLVLLFRWIEQRRDHSRLELLVNSADMLKEIIIDGAQSDEIMRALALLEQAGEDTELTRALRQVVLKADRAPDHPASIPTRAALGMRTLYEQLLSHRWFQRVLLLIFVGNAAIGVIVVGVFLAQGADLLFSSEERSFTAIGQAIGATLVWGLAVVGTMRLRRSRLAAFRWFKRSVLATIFFVQVFLFMQSQLIALFGLLANLMLLGGVNALIRAERIRRAEHGELPIAR
jgi:hypothetical protein